MALHKPSKLAGKHNPVKSMEDENVDVAADINAEGESQLREDSAEETVTLEQLHQEQEARRQVTARAKKAEDELRNLKASQIANPQLINKIPDDFKEELRLTSKGYSDEDIAKARMIAKGSDTDLATAIKDPMFIAYQQSVKDKERKENAKLGASKGSGETRQETSGLESGSTKEEHQAAFKKLNESIK